jgi:hypothetical protein
MPAPVVTTIDDLRAACSAFTSASAQPDMGRVYPAGPWSAIGTKWSSASPIGWQASAVCESGEGVRHLWFAMIRRHRPLAPRICSTLSAHGQRICVKSTGLFQTSR